MAPSVNVKIVPNDKGTPPGKLADVELHFSGSVFDGLKLIGFAVWERRTGNGRNVTFPARQFSVNGERRSHALLRPITDTMAQERVRDLILNAYAEYETEAATTPETSAVRTMFPAVVMLLMLVLASLGLGTGTLHAQTPPTRPTAQQTAPVARPQCLGTTKAGVRCKRTVAILKSGYCSTHANQAPVTAPKKGR